MALPPVVNCSGAEDPSCATVQTSSSPDLSEMKAIFEPSGDQRGHLSCAPEVFVRLRAEPFSMGAVKISPRAANRTRSPLGLRSASSIRLAAETRLGRRPTPSSGTLIEIGAALPLLISKI